MVKLDLYRFLMLHHHHHPSSPILVRMEGLQLSPSKLYRIMIWIGLEEEGNNNHTSSTIRNIQVHFNLNVKIHQQQHHRISSSPQLSLCIPTKKSTEVDRKDGEIHDMNSLNLRSN